MRLSNKNNVLFALLLCVLVGCYKEDDYHYSSNDVLEHLTVTLANDSIVADGTSTTKVTFSFPIEADQSLTTINIEASNGTFFESGTDKLTINLSNLDDNEENRVTEVTLISSTSVSDCILTSTVLDYVKRDTVHYKKAFPNNLTLTSSLFFVKNDSITLVPLLANLSSTNGTASKGQQVFFEYPLGVGLPSSNIGFSSATGESNFQYVLTDTSFVGTLLFKAKTLNSIGDTLVSTKSIEVID